MSFKLFVLSLVIIACGLFIFLKWQTLGPDNSQFNQTTRLSLGRHPVLRTLLSLHKDGDARAEYLLGTTPIVLEVVQPTSGGNQDVINTFAQNIKTYTGRDVQVYNEDVIGSGTLTEKDLAAAVTNFRRHILPDQPNLFVMLTNDFQGPADQVGRTYQEYGIVVSMSKLHSLTSNVPDAYPQFLQSTLLHEFGHQLGMDHVNNPACVMDASVENPSPATAWSGLYTPTQFCGEELNQLKAIKASLR